MKHLVRSFEDHPVELAHGMSVGKGFTATTWFDNGRFGNGGSAHQGRLVGSSRKLVAIGKRILNGESTNTIAAQERAGHELIEKVRALVQRRMRKLALHRERQRRYKARHPERVLAMQRRTDAARKQRRKLQRCGMRERAA